MSSPRRTHHEGPRIAHLLALGLLAMLSLTAFSCTPHADYWVVIASPALQSDCQTEDEVPNAPACLEVDKGDTVGFANFAEGDIKINVDPPDTFEGVTGSFTLKHGKWKVLTVSREGIQPLITLEGTTPPLGGPTMIIRESP